MPAQSKRPLALACLFDLHAGSSVAVQPAAWQISDGTLHGTQTINASPAQLWLYQCLQDYIKRVADLTKTHRVALLLGAEMVDGPAHHGTLQTHGSRHEQEDLAIDMLRPLAALAYKPGGQKPYIWALRGTSSHSGRMGASDARVARELGARSCTWSLQWNLGEKLINARHHTTSSRRAWTRGNSLRMLMRDIYLRALESNAQPPQLILRGHVHLFDHEYIPRYGHMQGAVSGGWKLTDEHTATFPDDIFSIGALIYFPSEHRIEPIEYSPAPGPIETAT